MHRTLLFRRLAQPLLRGRGVVGVGGRALRAYHAAEPEMEHSVVASEGARAPVNPPSLYPRASHVVNEMAQKHEKALQKSQMSGDEASEAAALEAGAALRAAAAADDARWAAYLADNWPSLAEKKAAVRAAGASEESVRAFNEELAEVMRRTGYVQKPAQKTDAEGGEWVPDPSAANHVRNAIGGAARWSAAAAGVQMSGAVGLETHADRVAYRNLNARRLAKHGGVRRKEKKTKNKNKGGGGGGGGGAAQAVAVAGDAELGWEEADAVFDAVAAHLGGCAPLFVDDARVVVPGDFSVRVVAGDASAMLMAHAVLEAFPASKQAGNFLNGAKAINVLLAPEMKAPEGAAEAVVGVEDDGTSRVALTGAAVSEATLRAALAISGEALMPAAEEA
jgi:hypothetical protein